MIPLQYLHSKCTGKKHNKRRRSNVTLTRLRWSSRCFYARAQTQFCLQANIINQTLITSTPPKTHFPFRQIPDLPARTPLLKQCLPEVCMSKNHSISLRTQENPLCLWLLLFCLQVHVWSTFDGVHAECDFNLHLIFLSYIHFVFFYTTKC